MASDLSSDCDDDIEIFEEREEGEISLEDVSSSEESHPTYRSGFRTIGECPKCRSLQGCATWCVAARATSRNSHRNQDAAYGKENRRGAKESVAAAAAVSAAATSKHSTATLQEKNDDFVPISSDSDMELVGLPGNSKPSRQKSNGDKVRRKRKKKRSRGVAAPTQEETLPLLSPPQAKTYVVDDPTPKKIRSSRLHHHETSPTRYRSPLARVAPASPSRRYRKVRPLKVRSPGRRCGSPPTRGNVAERKSLRKPRSPRRSPAARSPLKIPQFREVDTQATKLLKKVRRLENVGSGSKKDSSKRKEHSSLKEKLDNMLKTQAEVTRDKPHSRKRRNPTISNNNNNNKTNSSSVNGASTTVITDDEDDLELLRRKALETKRKKLESNDEQSKTNVSETNGEDSDENDIDPNHLRILALQSAVMKKHQQRIARGVNTKKSTKTVERVESPFNEIFLDEIYVTDDDSTSVKSTLPRSSPIVNGDSNNLEDMDIDTDVEREKEYYMPYSPTDDVTTDLKSSPKTSETNDDKENPKSFPTTMENNSIVDTQISLKTSDDNIVNENSHTNVATSKLINSELFTSQCSIDDLTDDDKSIKIINSSSTITKTKNFNDATSSSEIVETLEKIDESSSEIHENPNTPYSPTDNPILDPEMFPIFPNLPIASIENSSSPRKDEKNIFTTKIDEKNLIESNGNNNETDNDVAMLCADASAILSLREDASAILSLREDATAILSSGEDADGARPLAIGPLIPRALEEIEKLPEIDLDGSPLVQVSEEHEMNDVVIPIDVSPTTIDRDIEPLYLRCLADSAREATNKITALNNRTLVPTHILKTNKQLQQPLPMKKIDHYAEPSFKSAEMQPVNVDTTSQAKIPTFFKPIKLCPISKKSQFTTTAAAAFNASLNEDSSMEMTTNNEVPVVIDTTIVETKKTIDRSDTKKTIDRSDEKKKSNVDNDDRRERSKRDDRTKTNVKSTDRSNERSKIVETCSSGDSSSKRSSKSLSLSSSTSTSSSSSSTNSRAKKMAIEKSRDVRSNARATSRTKKFESSTSTSTTTTTRKRTTNEFKKKKTPSKNRRSRQRKKKFARESSIVENCESSKTSTDNVVDEKTNVRSHEDAEKCNNDEIVGKTARQETTRTMEDERNRRISMDEDEEALRAQLLASLPKRTKPTEIVASTIATDDSIPKISQIVNSTNLEISESVADAKNSSLTIVDKSSSLEKSSEINFDEKTINVATETTTNIFTSTKNNIVDDSNVVGPSSSSSSPRKRSSSVVLKGPPKKIIKKISPVVASTKVVNNAKKYQNALLLKKLQGTAMIYGTQNLSRNITLNNLKNNDAVRPSSPKASSASKIPQLIIKLGSDTDSENDTDGRATLDKNVCVRNEDRKPLTIPATDFEKSVEQFLKDQRMKQEAITVAKSASNFATGVGKSLTNSVATTVGKLSGMDNTPLAVRRHLPMSQQEEYRRLRQKIADHERQKRQKTMENGTTSQQTIVKSPSTTPGPLSPASPIAATLKNQQTNVKVTRITNQVPITTTVSPPSTTNKLLDQNSTINQRTNVKISGIQNQSTTTLSSPFIKNNIIDNSSMNKRTNSKVIPTAIQSSTTSPFSKNKILDNTIINKRANVKISGIVNQSSTIGSTNLLKNKIIDDSELLKKIKTTKSVDGRSVVDESTKIFKPIATASANKHSTKPLATSHDLQSNVSNVPKIPITSLFKTNSRTSLINTIPTTSTPNVNSQFNKRKNIYVKLSTPTTKISPTENPQKFDTNVTNERTKFYVDSSTSLTNRDVERRSSEAIGGSLSPSGRVTCARRASACATEILTIQIPNDKVQTDRLSVDEICHREDESSTSNRSPGMLRILTKEQLNNRFVKIQVQQGTPGRTVTVGDSYSSQNDGSTKPTIFTRGDDKKIFCCDNNSITNEKIVDVKREKRSDESLIGDSEDSTLIVSRNDSTNEKIVDATIFEDRAIVRSGDHDGNDAASISTASTVVLDRDNFGSRDNHGNSVVDDGEDRCSGKDLWDRIRTDVRNELEVLGTLGTDRQRIILMESQENLVAKRNMVLDDLTEMSGCLRQLDAEREIQTQLVAEVQRLREKLYTAEKQLYDKRRQMNGISGKVTKAHEKINHGRRECYKLSLICRGLGTKNIGEDYKVPETGAQLLHERLKEVAIHTRQLSKKKVPSVGTLSESRDANYSNDDVVSEISFANKSSESTTATSETTYVVQPKNSSILENDVNDNRPTIANSPDNLNHSVGSTSPTQNENASLETRATFTEISRPSTLENNSDKINNKSTSNSLVDDDVRNAKKNTEPIETDVEIRKEEATGTFEDDENDDSIIVVATATTEDANEDTFVCDTAKTIFNRQLSIMDGNTMVKTKIDRYESVLKHLKSSRSVNPDGILCPYELMGTCSDGDCQFIHLNPGHCQ